MFFLSSSSPIKRKELPCCFFLIVLFFVLFSLFSTAFAYRNVSARVAADSALDKQPEHMARAGVSVVRVVSLYQLTDTNELLVCNGLGSLIASGEATAAANPSQPVTNVVLTDGSLVNPERANCRETIPFESVQLLSVKVIFSSFFFEPREVGSGEKEKPFMVEGLDARAIQCLNTVDCAQGPALLTFSTSKNLLFPFLEMTNNGEAQANLTLRNALDLAASPPGSQTFPTQQRVDPFMINVDGFITPMSTPLTSGSETKLEPGTPTVDKTGRLMQVHLSRNPLGAFKSTQIAPLLAEQFKQLSPNPVHENWQNGVTQFYQGQSSTGENQKTLFKNAEESFKKAADINADFRGAFAFQQIASEAGAPQAVGVPQSIATPQPTQTSTAQGQQNILSQNWLGFPLLAWFITGTLGLLVSLFIVGYLSYGKIRAKRKRAPQEELEEAERRSGVDAQRIAEQQIVQNAAVVTQPPEERKHQVSSQQRASQPPLSSFPLILASPQQQEQSWPSPTAPLTDERLASSQFSQVDTPASVVQPPSQASLEQAPLLEEDKEVQQDRFIGERLGNYRLLRSLGQGGFADVYLGEHVFLKTNAAIKVLHREVRGRDLKTFLQEAQLIATLNHPHIVRVLEFGIKGLQIPEMELDQVQSLLVLRGQIPYLVMDYARGGTLRERYPKGTCVPLQQVILWLESLAQALDYAHEQKVIHRDVKPENILMTNHQHIVLSDFGIATLAHSEHSIKTLEIAGTVPYMAPEQIRGRPCPASDQYALAVVVYEWLCGERPFKGNVWEILEHHRSTPPAPLLTKIPSLPHAVEEVVMKALAKEPQMRFENVTAFARALRDARR